MVTIFVRQLNFFSLCRVYFMTTYGWYGACSPLRGNMATKPPNTYSNDDRNWHWPENTWFRERLNALKAQEQEQRRKPATRSADLRNAVPAYQNETDGLKVG